MQEDVENRTVALVINSGRLSSQVLRAALLKLLAEMKKHKAQKSPYHQGKQSVKQLIKQGAGVSNIEVTHENIKSFERVARKYGVDYAIKKDTTGDKPKYLIFFKARDADALTAAFTEYTSKVLKNEDRPSVLEQLAKYKDLIKKTFLDRVKNKEKELSR